MRRPRPRTAVLVVTLHLISHQSCPRRIKWAPPSITPAPSRRLRLGCRRLAAGCGAMTSRVRQGWPVFSRQGPLALERQLVFCATSAVTPRARIAPTHPLVSPPYVRAERLGMEPASACLVQQNGDPIPFCRPRSVAHQEVHQQAAAVLHQRMGQEHQIGLLPLALPEASRLWVRRALGGVGPPLPIKSPPRGCAGHRRPGAGLRLGA